MPIQLTTTSAASSIDALATTIAAAKQGDALAPVTVVVPTNVSGVMARRALGREHGIVGVDMITLNRLAELLAGPVLAAQCRRPTSTPVLQRTVRKVLDEAPGSFRRVADHPATIDALREAHQEIRLAGDDAVDSLSESRRGREAVRVSAAVTRILQRRWYDEADLLDVATDRLSAPVPDALRRVVVHLPQHLGGRAARFVRRLGDVADVAVLTVVSGDTPADVHLAELCAQLGISTPVVPAATASEPPRPARVVSTTDADDEVCVAVRTIVDAARGATLGRPVPFERMALLWPTQRPYARLVEHHLRRADIPFNGSGGTELTERLAPRLLLDLLDIDRRGLRRRALFEFLADLPKSGRNGEFRRVVEWERVSRYAGVSLDDDWGPRLAALASSERWGESAASLRGFVEELRATLGRPSATASWRSWVDWSVEQVEAWLGKGAIAKMSDAEYRAWESLMNALERLRCLDEIDEPVVRSEFRTVLESELADAPVREGRIGTGVTVGALASAVGLDVDVVVVVGCAEGMLPPAPASNPLLGDADRERAGLRGSDDHRRRLHHAFRSLSSATHLVATYPRGDLRSTSDNQPSRWLSVVPSEAIEIIASSTAGLAAVEFPPTERERRLRDHLRRNRSQQPIDASTDPGLAARLALVASRRAPQITVYDGDLTGADVPSLGDRPVSPTQIERWAACPHAYFMTYLLGIRPVDEPDADISINAMDRGNVQHEALDRFHRDVLAGRLPQPGRNGWSDQHREVLLAHFDEVCDDLERAGRTGRPATWAGHRQRLRTDLMGWFDRDSERCRTLDIHVLGSEHSFAHSGDEAATVSLLLPSGRQLPMRGSIDRVDRCGDGTIVVTDHKTGRDTRYAKIAAEEPTLGGSAFQLPTYAAAAVARFGSDGDPVRVRSEYSMFERGGYKRIGYAFDESVWEQVSRDLDHVVAGIESGWFPQVPERPGFRVFVSCEYCEPDHLGTAAAWERWQRKRRDPRIARWFGAEPDESDRAVDDV